MTQKEIDYIRAKERWLKLFEQWQESGLSIERFCKENAVSVASFYRWKRVIATEIMADAQAACALNTPALGDEARLVLDAMQAAVKQRRSENRNKLKERTIILMLDAAEKTPGGDFAPLSTAQIAKALGSTVSNIKNIIRWMIEKQLISHGRPGKSGWKVYITREEYDSIKKQLFSTNFTAKELLAKQVTPDLHDEISAKLSDEPSTSADTFAGIVFDLANRMIHISNEPTEAAIEAAVRLLPSAFSGSKKELAPT